MSGRDLVSELNAAAREHDDDLGDLLGAAAEQIETQSGELEELRSELEETNEGMVALTLELQEAEARYRSLFEDAVEGIYKTDPDGREYVMANSSMASILGYGDSDELAARVECLREEVFVDPERYDEYERRLREEGRVEGFEYRICRRDGEIRWVSDNARALTEDGERTGYRGGVIDITERKEYEDRLEARTEELEALNRVLRHDIANDMQVIRGFAEHLRENIDEPFRPQAGKIVTTTDHVLELTEEARTFVEAVTGYGKTELAAIPLEEPLTYVIERQRDAYPQATISLDTEIPDVAVRANEMLSSVLRNLCNNAVKHNQRPNPTVEIAVERQGDAVEIRITDDGPGVPDDRKDAIFGKGEQSVDSEGTGIGLYLVNELVTSYDGEVWAEDRPDGNSGTVFVVRLPVAE